MREENNYEAEPRERTLGLTPTWSVATVLTVFVVVSLIVERSIHRLSNWLQKTKRKPLFAALEKMKEELMLLGFISLLLTAISSTIANICVSSSFYDNRFVPCSRSEINEEHESTISSVKRSQLTRSPFLHILRRRLVGIGESTCSEIHRWRMWEDEAQMDRNDRLTGSNLYFWLAIIPITLVLFVGAKLQHVIATLVLENAGITEYASGVKLRPRDELFWFKKPELLLSLIHFIQFQNAFELASFFWFWWQFGYNSCFLTNHLLVYMRLILGFAGQFLCSYSTLPLYALVTQMGTNYKAALLPQRVRETINGWGKATRRKRRHGLYGDDSTIRTETSTVASIEEYDHQVLDVPEASPAQGTEHEMQLIQHWEHSISVPNENSSRVGTPLLKPCASISSTTLSRVHTETTDPLSRSSSLPVKR
ncbi:hypothetical protein Bca101_055239 [Brassica carinata]